MLNRFIEGMMLMSFKGRGAHTIKTSSLPAMRGQCAVLDGKTSLAYFFLSSTGKSSIQLTPQARSGSAAVWRVFQNSVLWFDLAQIMSTIWSVPERPRQSGSPRAADQEKVQVAAR